MPFALVMFLGACALFAGMLALMELGARLGRRRRERDPEGARAGTAAADGAVFGLLGLLIAFSFSGAASRFEARRERIVVEVNAIGTAWQRLDLLPPDTRAELQQAFRDYLDARLAAYGALPDREAAWSWLARAAEQQERIWSRAVEACRGEGQPYTNLVLPTLNAMFDIASERTATYLEHPPGVVFGLLVALSLACALLVGFAMAASSSRNMAHRIAFAAVIAITVYAILELEYPRLGLVQVSDHDHLLVELRARME